jgi:hypothetical protein
MKLSKHTRKALKAIFGNHLSDDQLWTTHRAFVESMLDELVDEGAVSRNDRGGFTVSPYWLGRVAEVLPLSGGIAEYFDRKLPH